MIGSYCLMTNHFHLLLYPESRESFIRFMKNVSQIYSQYFNRKYKRTGKVWENRYKLNIVDPKFEWVISRYIEQNPVRAGMVRVAEQYQYSSVRIHLEGKKDEIVMKDIIEGKVKQYKEFFGENITEDQKLLKQIRIVTQQEKVFGKESFIREIEKRTNLNFSVRAKGRPKKEINKQNK